MKLLWVYFSLVIFIPLCSCASILAIVPTPSHSHQIPFRPLWKELSLRGHKVTVFTTDPQNNPNLTNLTEVDMKWVYQFFSNVGEMAEGTVNMWNAYDMLIKMMKDVSEGQLGYGPVQKLLRGEEHFDVLLVEIFFPEFLGFAEIFNCPKILIGSMVAPTFIHRLYGNPTHPLLFPEFLTPFYGNLNFKERVTAVIYDLYLSLHQIRNLFHGKQIILNKYFNTTSTIEGLISDVDMLFLNVNPVLQTARALGPATITIGGYLRDTSNNSLPKVSMQYSYSVCEYKMYFSPKNCTNLNVEQQFFEGEAFF